MLIAAMGSNCGHSPAGGPGAAITGRITDVDRTRISRLPHAMLASTHGGPLSTTMEQDGLAPRDTLYRVRILLDKPPAHLALQRG